MKTKIICKRRDLLAIKLLAKLRKVHIEVYSIEILNFWDYIRIAATSGATVKITDSVVVCDSDDVYKLKPFVSLF